ncbi:MAG: DNA translocase FtsK [Chlorobi bacterium]|nr:DNA translocase FtsK [Chlorobiota bacterium]
MKQTRKNITKKKTHSIKGFKPFTDDRIRFITATFLILLGIYLTFAFISYFFTWKTDQSFESSHVLSRPDIIVENWAGKFGAYFSMLFMDKWFGIFSFSVPLFLIYVGLHMFRIRLAPPGKVFWLLTIFTILGSLSLAYLFGSFHGWLGSGPGGGHGFYMIQWLNGILGKLGTGLFLLLLLLTFFVFFFRIPVFHIRFHLKKEKNTSDVVEGSVPFSQVHPDTEYTEPGNEPQPETISVKPDFNEKRIIPESNDDVILTVEQKNRKEDQLSDKEIKSQQEKYDPKLDLSGYRFPPVSLLHDHETGNSKVSQEELISNKNRIVETLGNYKIQIDKIKATIGPTVTLYEIVPAPGIRISKIKNLEDDIALSLSALGIRIIAPIPGRGTIGIEVPNQHPEIVSLKSMITSKKFQEAKFELPVALGRTISNEAYIFDLVRMPHLLVAGATGQGKSVGLNAIITSLLYKKHPAELKFVLIDPKKVELTLYTKLEKHFLARLPDTEEAIITDTQKVINTLNALTIEMDQRYDLLKAAHVRNIHEYNEKFTGRRLNPEKGHRYLPYIVLIIDEFADLIMTAGREVETPLARLAQLARAIGIHLVIATQRPTTNIITGVIKANFPARIAFKVTSMIDSRTILDSTGANQLVGRGDMLISSGSDLIRVQCAFIDTGEIDGITEFIAGQQGYPTAFMLPEYSSEDNGEPSDFDPRQKDSLFEEAARLVVLHQQGSTSLIQRKLSIGYNRAGRIIDQLETAGIVGPFEGSKARHVLIPDEYALEQFLRNLDQ